MSNIKVFEDKKIRSKWNETEEDWYFSVVDVVEILTESKDYQTARNYWKVLKNRLNKEGSELVTNCNRLKLQSADGKFYMQDVLNTKGILRLIQSIPSKKAEPFKMWLATSEVTTTAMSKEQKPNTMAEHKRVAKEGGEVAKTAKIAYEQRVGKKAISKLNAKNKNLLEIKSNNNE